MSFNRNLAVQGWPAYQGLENRKPAPIPWTPEQITTSLWLDAADSTTITIATGVSEWRDKSGNNRNAGQTTTGNQPAFVSEGFSDLPVVRFDGVNDSLTISPSLPAVSGQNVFAVVDTTSLQSSNRSFLIPNTVNTSNLSLYFALPLNGGGDYRPAMFWANAARASWGAGIQRPAIIRWGYVSGTTGTALTQVDAAPVVESSFSTGSLDDFVRISASGGDGSAFDLSELVVLSPVASQDVIDRTFGYLAHKWGLTANLPADHPYKNAPPFV